MAAEIELKFALPPERVAAFLDHPLLAAVAPQSRRLENRYFDTPAHALHDRRIAFRFRKKGSDWLSTVKTAGVSQDGLSCRGEWEVPAVPGVFDFSAVDDPEVRAFLVACANDLRPVFSTDFERQAWRLPVGQSQIEVALDRGEIHAAGRVEVISEVELELLSGVLDDLLAFGRQLQADLALVPADLSKAERGYRLLLAT